MKIVLIGPPASGKGTQANLLEKHFNIPHISTGDMFRQIMTEQTPLGREVYKYMSKASMVPDSTSIKVVENHLKKPEFEKGFILDGYPRTLKQATLLDKVIDIDYAILIDVDFEELKDRILTRAVCFPCSEVYNTKTYKESTCKICGRPLTTRLDDNLETIAARYKEYEVLTLPVVEYYKSNNRLEVLKGDSSIKELFSDIKELIGN